MNALPNPFETEPAAAPPAAEECRFVLDERAFMEAIEPPPLFLQRVPREVMKILSFR